MLAVGAASCGGDDDGGTGEGLVLLVRESSGDLFAVEPLAEVSRDDRVLENFVSTTPITVTRGGQPESVDVAALGGRQVIVADISQGASVLVLGGEEPVTLLSADASSLSATVSGGVLYVRERRGSSQRCHRGDTDGLERVYRGDYCNIADSGHILGGTVTASGVHDVTVLDPDGGELLNSSFDARPALSSDGRYLITTDRAGVTVTRTADGETLWGLPDGTGATAAAAAGRLAVAALDRDGIAVLVVLSAEGGPQRLETVDTGDVVARFAPGGDLYWTADGALWVNPNGSADIEELADADDLDFFDLHDSGAITAIVDDFGIRVDRHTPGNDTETLHELDDQALTQWLIADDGLYLATATLASIVPLDGGDPTDSERWDEITMHDTQNGTLVAAGNDSGDQTLFTLHANGDITEFDEHDRIHSAQVHNNTLYATVTSNNSTTTIVYDTKTGEQHIEPDYQNYTLAPNTTQPRQTTLSITADYTPPPAAPEPETAPAQPGTAAKPSKLVPVPEDEQASLLDRLPPEFLSVSAGGVHSCGLRTDNTIQCWGRNEDGQADAPGGQFLSVSAGRVHSCGLRTDNTIQCWGSNIIQYGLRSIDSRYTGQANPPGGQFLSVSSGGDHSCGLLTDNTIHCWGDYAELQLRVPGGQFLSVSSGGEHSCGLRTDNTIQCWGDYAELQLRVPGGQFLSASSGGEHSCGLRTDNTIQCWGAGRNEDGEADAPGGQFLSVSAGRVHSCGLRTDNTIQCWGRNEDGQADAP